MMSKDTDDIKLIKKAIRGNSTAYGYLIEKHRTYLYKMAFLYTNINSISDYLFISSYNTDISLFYWLCRCFPFGRYFL